MASVPVLIACVALIMVVAVCLPRLKQQPRAVWAALPLIVAGHILTAVDRAVVGVPIMGVGTLVVSAAVFREIAREGRELTSTRAPRARRATSPTGRLWDGQDHGRIYAPTFVCEHVFV
jgi:hypothetical protein